MVPTPRNFPPGRLFLHRQDNIVRLSLLYDSGAIQSSLKPVCSQSVIGPKKWEHPPFHLFPVTEVVCNRTPPFRITHQCPPETRVIPKIPRVNGARQIRTAYTAESGQYQASAWALVMFGCRFASHNLHVLSTNQRPHLLSH